MTTDLCLESDKTPMKTSTYTFHSQKLLRANMYARQIGLIMRCSVVALGSKGFNIQAAMIISTIKFHLFSFSFCFYSEKKVCVGNTRDKWERSDACIYAGLCGFSTLMVRRNGRINSKLRISLLHNVILDIFYRHGTDDTHLSI